MSQHTSTEGAEAAEQRYLSFSLGTEEYAVPLLSVREVIGVPEITPIPFTPPHFLGIMNLRGSIISVIDMRVKFGIKPKNSAETAVIICDLAPLTIGIMIDSINSVVAPKPSELSDKPDMPSQRSSEYITKVFKRDKDLILLLDISKSLSLEDLRANSAATSKAA